MRTRVICVRYRCRFERGGRHAAPDYRWNNGAGAGERLHEMDPQRVAMIEDQMRASARYHYDGSTAWVALLRKLDRESPDYRT